MKKHLWHLLMCAPMLVIALVAVASGASLGVFASAVGCTLMMAVMMGGMMSGGSSSDSDRRRRR